GERWGSGGLSAGGDGGESLGTPVARMFGCGGVPDKADIVGRDRRGRASGGKRHIFLKPRAAVLAVPDGQPSGHAKPYPEAQRRSAIDLQKGVRLISGADKQASQRTDRCVAVDRQPQCQAPVRTFELGADARGSLRRTGSAAAVDFEFIFLIPHSGFLSCVPASIEL